jgi:hypothetical protein
VGVRRYVWSWQKKKLRPPPPILEYVLYCIMYAPHVHSVQLARVQVAVCVKKGKNRVKKTVQIPDKILIF